MTNLNERELLGLIKELVDHLEYIGWGDAYEREIVNKPGQLRDRAEQILKRNELR